MTHTKALFLIIVYMFAAINCETFNVDPKSRNFIDSTGRVRIFHGVNAVYKVPPYIPILDKFDPQLSFSQEDVDNLYEWGFNFVRLGTMWPGVEPARGQYNKTYLSELKTLVDRLAEKNIFVLLDCHQDLLSRKFCGEGAPDWAINVTDTALPFPYPAVLHEFPLDQNGYPQLDACLQYSFARFYFSVAVGSAFQSLFDNVNNIQNAFAGFWTTVVSQFKDSPNVFGYELINEPWPGDVYKYPDLLVQQGKADKEHLLPLYDYLTKQIKQLDQDKMIVYEPTLVDLVTTKSGFDRVPGGSQYNNKSVFSYHVYCGYTSRTGEPSNEFLCDAMQEYMFDGMIDDFLKIGGGGFMTEWGDMPNGTIDIDTINFIAGQADRLLQSWAWWQFKSYQDLTTQGRGTSEAFYDQNGNLQTGKVTALSRTYAYAIAGEPQSSSFDPSTNIFKLVYTTKAGVTGPTEIYLNSKWRYSNGFNILINPQGAATWTQVDANHIQVNNNPNTLGTQITITVQPK